MNNNTLIAMLSEPYRGETAAKVDIDAGDGNLTIDRLTGGEPMLVSGALEYDEKQGPPTRSLVSSSGKAAITLKGGSSRRPWFRFPWTACNGGADWRIHLNPDVPADITARCDGGNIRLDLTGMAVTSISAGTGGGNIDLVLPDRAANLNAAMHTGAGNVTIEIGDGLTGRSTFHAKSGAGTVTVRIPSGIAACIHAAAGLGKATVDPRFSKIDDHTYQSQDFDQAANRVEITANSGAGSVIVSVS